MMRLRKAFIPLVLLFSSWHGIANATLPVEEPWLAQTADYWAGQLGIVPGQNKGFGVRLYSTDIFFNTTKYRAWVYNNPQPNPLWAKAVTDQWNEWTIQVFKTLVPSRSEAIKLCGKMGARLATFPADAHGLTSKAYWNKYIAPAAEKAPKKVNSQLYAKMFALDLRMDGNGTQFYEYENKQNILYGTGFNNPTGFATINDGNEYPSYPNLIYNPYYDVTWSSSTTQTAKQVDNYEGNPYGNYPWHAQPFYGYYISAPDNGSYDGSESTGYINWLAGYLAYVNNSLVLHEIPIPQYPVCEWIGVTPEAWAKNNL